MLSVKCVSAFCMKPKKGPARGQENKYSPKPLSMQGIGGTNSFLLFFEKIAVFGDVKNEFLV